MLAFSPPKLAMHQKLADKVEEQPRSGHIIWDDTEAAALTVVDGMKMEEAEEGDDHYEWSQHIALYPGGLAEHTEHYRYKTKLGKDGVVVPNSTGHTKLQRSAYSSTLVTRDVGNTQTLELWELLEKQKLIASEQAGRLEGSSASERLRNMLLVASGESPGTVSLPAAKDRKRQPSPSVSSEQPTKANPTSKAKAKTKASPAPKSKQGLSVDSADAPSAPSQPKSAGGKSGEAKAVPPVRGQPRKDLHTIVLDLLQKFMSSDEGDHLWWGPNAATQRKECGKLEKQVQARLERNLKDDSVDDLNYAKKVTRLLQMAVTLGIDNPSLDGNGFRQSFDKIETERYLPPEVDF